MRCFLVGLPGSGKTTLSRMLANRLGVSSVDSDVYIEERIGCSIRAYFEQRGEGSFRDVEAEVIDELTAKPGHMVLATGGGAVLRDANRTCLHSRGAVFYLHARPELLYNRLRHDTKRPLLQGGDPLEKLRELYAARDPLYREVAHHVVDVGRHTTQGLVADIQAQLAFDYPDFPRPQA